MEKTMSKNKEIRKYSKEEGCYFCTGKNFTKVSARYGSNMMCDNCKAIYHSIDLDDQEKAGTFTGERGIVSREFLMNNDITVNKRTE